jgi:hypothetical protein
MMASRGMGDINPSKIPKAKKKARKDNTDFTQYSKGGRTRDIPGSSKHKYRGGKIG